MLFIILCCLYLSVENVQEYVIIAKEGEKEKKKTIKEQDSKTVPWRGKQEMRPRNTQEKTIGSREGQEEAEVEDNGEARAIGLRGGYRRHNRSVVC